MPLATLLALVLLGADPAGKTPVSFGSEVIQEKYAGRIEEPKPQYLYSFYGQDQPYPKGSLGKNYPATIQRFKEILIQNESFPLMREMAMSMILLVYNLMENYDTTKAVGSAYLRQYPQSSEMWRSHVLYELAEGYYYTAQSPEAERLYKKVKEDFPSAEMAPYASVSLGWIYLQQERYSEATWEFKTLIDQNPSATVVVLAVFGTGIAYYNQAKYDTALSYFSFDEERYRKQNVYCTLAADLVDRNLYYAGLCYARLGFNGDALDSWKKLVAKYIDSPKAADAALRIGDLYFRAADYQSAIAYLRVASDKYPDSPGAHTANLLIAQSYYNLNQDTLAQKTYRMLLTRYPSDSATILLGMGASYARMAQNAATPEIMERVLDEFAATIPNSNTLPELTNELGNRLFKAGRYADAADAYERVVLNWPALPVAADAQLQIAACFTNLKDWPQTARAYQSFVDNFPKDPRQEAALFYLGVVYYTIGSEKFSRDSFRKALNYFEQVMSRYPKGEFFEKAQKYADLSRRMLS